MSDDDLTFDSNDAKKLEKTEGLSTEKELEARKRFLRDQIELREMAKELGLSVEDYLDLMREK